MRPWVSSGSVHIRELLDLVGTIGVRPGAIEDAVRHLYDWHNGRAVVGMQLTFAPAATAILAIVAKPGSTLVVAVASAVVLATLVIGFALLMRLNWLHGEYVFAVRLAAEFRAFEPELALYPHGVRAPEGSVAYMLYDQIGSTSMVTYRSDPKSRERVLNVLSSCAPSDDDAGRAR
jgi:hypothetical protein